MVINIEDFLLELFIKGVFVEGESNVYIDLKRQNLQRYKRFDFYFNHFRYGTYMEKEGKTPYKFAGGNLYYNNEILRNIKIERIEESDWGSEKSWYIKKWNNLENEPYELRLNPINMCSNLRYSTGEQGEFRGCAFCHRVYTHSRNAENRKIVPVQTIFNEIFLQEGVEILKNIKKVLIMTGNMKSTEAVLNLCHEIYAILEKQKYTGVFSISTNQICTEESIKDLSSMDNTIFDYTLEVFERRKCLMGEQKGYDIAKVINTLTLARKYFQYIRINYIVGLDSYNSLEMGLSKLKNLNLIDDVVPAIFVPYTPEMKALRNEEATEIDYYKKVREFFQNNSLVPLKNGLTKNLFQEDKLDNDRMDELLEIKK